MLDGLNKYGLPIKYGIIGFFGGIIGAFLSYMLGLNDDSLTYILMPIATCVGGAVGGWLRQRKGKNS